MRMPPDVAPVLPVFFRLFGSEFQSKKYRGCRNPIVSAHRWPKEARWPLIGNNRLSGDSFGVEELRRVTVLKARVHRYVSVEKNAEI